MKNLLLLFFAFTIFACSNDDDWTTGVTNESATIANTETYRFVLGAFNEVSFSTIRQQASNFERSEIVYDSVSSIVNYYYKAPEGFVGNEEIKLYYENTIAGQAKTDLNIYLTVTE